MHELSIISEALRMAEEAATVAGAQRILAVRLRIGRLSGVAPDAMNFAWDVAREGTLAETARLDIESVNATWWCAHCEMEFDSLDYLNDCPKCRRATGDLRRGRELEIVNLEIE